MSKWKSVSHAEAALQFDIDPLKMLSFMFFCHILILHSKLIHCRDNSTVLLLSVPEDHHVCLRCGGSDSPDVVWTHQDRKVPVTRQDRYETKGEPERYLLQSDGSLLILKLDDSDSGEYRCNKRLVAELQVLTGHDLRVSAGRTLLLPCHSTNKPKHRRFYRRRERGRGELIFTWFKNGTVKPEREGSRLSYGNDALQIQDLQPEDAGDYLCNVKLLARLTVLTVQPEPTSILQTSKTATPAVMKTAETKKKEKARSENVLLMVAVVGLGLMILLLAAVCVLLISIKCRRERKYGCAEREVPDGLPLPEETIHYASLGRQNWRERPSRTPPDQNHHNVIYSSVITQPAAR